MAVLYSERADLYDVVYQWKDYAAEAARVVSLLGAYGVGPGARVLEAACGTGGHLVHLARSFQVAGFDRSEDMLGVARGKLPAVPLWQADMVTVRPGDVDGPYDAVCSLFSSIGYVWPEARLRQALHSLAGLLRPGGVLVLEPWLDPGSYRPGRPSLQTAALPDLDADPADLYVARGGVAGLRVEDGLDISVMDLHYLVIPRGGQVEHFQERHELWLCPRAVMIAAAEAAGLQVTWLEQGLMTGRGLLVGVRR